MMQRRFVHFILLSIVGLFPGWGRAAEPIGVQADGPPIAPSTSQLMSPDHQATDVLNGLPLYFVHNEGQLSAEIEYHAKINRADIYFTSSAIVYQFHHLTREGRGLGMSQQQAQSEKVRVVFMGAAQGVVVEGNRPTRATFSYYLGSDPRHWVSGAPAYGTVTYKELYPGIDLVVNGDGGRIKQEYRIRPGGDPSQIALRYDGIQNLSTNAKGQLEVRMCDGVLVEDTPVAYQIVDGHQVSVRADYVVSEDRSLRFSVGEHRTDTELIIDPTLVYSTYLGGGDYDWGAGIAVDTDGNVYVAGTTFSGDYPNTNNGPIPGFSGGVDVVLTKLDPKAKTLVYSLFIGDAGWEYCNGLVLDQSGYAYVMGHTMSSGFPTTTGAYDRSLGGPRDAFVTKVNPQGTAFTYSTYLGGGGDDAAYSIAVDSGGNVFVTGETSSADFPTTAGASDSTSNGGKDAFVTKIGPGGDVLQYSTYLGGGYDDVGSGIAVDSNGNSYVTGDTTSINFPTTPGAYWVGPFNHDPLPNQIFLTKLDSSGSALAYSTYLGDEYSWNYGKSVAVDSNGGAYVTGFTMSSMFPTTPNAYDPGFNGWWDVFVTKFDPAGASPALAPQILLDICHGPSAMVSTAKR